MCCANESAVRARACGMLDATRAIDPEIGSAIQCRSALFNIRESCRNLASSSPLARFAIPPLAASPAISEAGEERYSRPRAWRYRELSKLVSRTATQKLQDAPHEKYFFRAAH